MIDITNRFDRYKRFEPLSDRPKIDPSLATKVRHQMLAKNCSTAAIATRVN